MRRSLLIGATVAFASTACGDGTGPDASVSIDEIISGRVEGPGRTAIYTMDGTEGQTLRAFFQATSGDGRDSLALQVLTPDGASVLTRVTSAGSQPTLEQRASGLFTLSTSGRFLIEVRGLDTGTDQGPFQFRISPIDLDPENAASTLTIGTVVTGESIDKPGDVDAFTFEGAGGDELVAFIRGMGGSSLDSLVVTISTPQLPSFQRVATTPGDADSVRAHGSGRFVLPTSGTYVARVAGQRVSIEMDYQLEIVRVSREPERASEAIPVGTIVEEAIDYRGDLDEFYLDVADGEGFTIRWERLSGTPDSPDYLTFVSPTGTTLFFFYRWPGDPNPWASAYPTGSLRAGRYRFRVFADGAGRNLEPGAYRFLVEHVTP
jgi:hypothetical protein